MWVFFWSLRCWCVNLCTCKLIEPIVLDFVDLTNIITTLGRVELVSRCRNECVNVRIYFHRQVLPISWWSNIFNQNTIYLKKKSQSQRLDKVCHYESDTCRNTIQVGMLLTNRKQSVIWFERFKLLSVLLSYNQLVLFTWCICFEALLA